MPKQPKQNIIYARYSTEMQSTSSCTDQDRNVREYLQKKGIDPASFRLIADEAMSGTDESRPGYSELLALIESGQLGTLALDEVTRLTRNSNAAGIFKDITARMGRVICCYENMDTGCSEQDWKVQLSVAQLQTAMEKSKTSYRVGRGVKGKVLSSATALGDWCYGYDTTPVEANWVELLEEGKKFTRRYVIIETQAFWVRKAFELFEQNVSVPNIVRKFTQEGAPKSKKSRGKSDWTYFMIDTMLRNRKYIGEWKWGVRTILKDQGGVGHTQKTDPSTHQLTLRPELRIITDELFESVQQKLAERSLPFKGRKVHPHHRYPKLPLSGLLMCGACKRPMGLWRYVGEDKPLFRCRHRASGYCLNDRTLHSQTVIKAVTDEVYRLCAADSDWIAEYVRKFEAAGRAEMDAQPEQLRNAQVKMGKAETAVKNLLDLVAEHGRQSPAGERYGLAQNELTEVKAEVKRLKLIAEKQSRKLPTATEIVATIKSAVDRLATGDADAAAVLHQIVCYATIELFKNPDKKFHDANIRFRLSPIGALKAAGLKVPEAMELPELDEVVVSLDTVPKSKLVLTEVKAMRAAGVPWKQIADKFKISTRVLSMRVKEEKEAAASKASEAAAAALTSDDVTAEGM